MWNLLTRILQLLVTTVHLALVVLVFVLFTLVSPVIWLLCLPFDRNRRIFHYFLSIWSWCLIRANPLWRLRIEGRDLLPAGAAVYCANHQSLMDILVLYCLFTPFKWVAKRELFRVPLIGWMLSLGDYVSIRRSSRADARRMIGICRRWLRRRVPIMIFPEGTRSRSGRVGRFKHGAFNIAQTAGVPIVPIAVTGSRELIPALGLRRLEIRTIWVRVLPPVPVDKVQALEAHALSQLVEQTIRENVGQ